MKDKRVLIVGAGAMGRLWGGYLSTTCQIFFAPRSQHSLPENYRLKRPDGQVQDVVIPTLHSTETTMDLALLTTKAHQAEQALTEAQPWLTKTTPIVLFQNGMGSQQSIAARFPAFPLIAAVTTEGVWRQDTGQVIHAGYGETRVGGLTPAGVASAAAVTETLAQSSLKVTTDADVNSRLWQKLAVNAGINPFTVILDCCNGDLIGAPFFEQHIGAVCDEVSALMNAHDIAAKPGDLERRIRHVAYQTMQNSSSMRQDIKAGKTTEIDMINGFIVRESRRAGLDAPVNRMLAEAVKDHQIPILQP